MNRAVAAVRLLLRAQRLAHLIESVVLAVAHPPLRSRKDREAWGDEALAGIP